MGASSVTGKGGGSAGKLTTKELSALAVGPAIYAAGVIAAQDISSSPPMSSFNEVVLPNPLPGGSDAYIVMLTSLNGGDSYVVLMNEEDGYFTGFVVGVETSSDVFYMVVKKGFRPNI